MLLFPFRRNGTYFLNLSLKSGIESKIVITVNGFRRRFIGGLAGKSFRRRFVGGLAGKPREYIPIRSPANENDHRT